MKLYKIRHKVTGLYSLGGIYPSWSKRGKTWRKIGDLKNHFNLIQEHRARDTIADMVYWEVIISEYQEVNVGVSTVDELMA